MGKHTAKGRWEELAAKRTGLTFRCERYANLTLPYVCPEDGYDEGQEQLSQSLNSIGAQAVNNLMNKMVLAMFAPSRPFMRLDLPAEEMAAIMNGLNLTEAEFREELAIMEREMVKHLDGTGARPKLFDLFAHLIITGNCLRLTEDDTIRIIGVKDFVSRRNIKGEVIEILMRECVTRDELPEDLHQFCRSGEDVAVNYFRWWKWDGKVFKETQYIDDVRIELPKYNGQYKRTDMPAQHHVWRLPDKRHYGIGHVEDFIGDFEGLNDLTEAEVNGAILASEFRWLVNPGGMTRPEDFKTSVNGEAIPGVSGDIELVNAAAVGPALAVVSASADKYIRRIGAGFLLSGAVQRDAERVTAEEIRMLASELETGLGGIYSRLAIDLQLPIAYWLMKKVGNGMFSGSDFTPTIVTGLDALSRNGDLEAMQLFLNDVVGITTMPPQVLQYLKLDSIFSALAAGRGLRSSDFINKQDVVDTRNQDALMAQQQRETDMYATKTELDKQ
ncbi:head-tail adaptor [Pectobacterium phage Arno160]|uniref:Head-to-tail connector protein n=1 Tax=Pectobacterium phage Arno160 TaxID=2488835 RepID=A0A3G8F1W6_9CAUD|nr:head-tail adaptor [Pectobacterium phage Arno160]AZF88095.1 head-to-tail connector protein [Pectobacterium phage Arno160]